MFQRLKSLNLESFVVNKIAEEQAKQNADQQGRNASPARRSTSTTNAARKAAGETRRPPSPSASKTTSRAKIADPLGVSGAKGPDPEEFVIGEDGSDMSRAATPRPVKESVDSPVPEPAAKKEDKDEKTVSADDVLSEDVRKKLVKLEVLTSKYQDLLRNYRTAHARVAQIEPFESTLREHTPLTGIAEPGALVEFLQQRSRQSDMVMDELKRVTGEQRQLVGERDAIKKQLDEAERKAKDALDEAERRVKDAFEEATGLQVADGKESESERKVTDMNTDTSSSELETARAGQQEELQKQIAYINELATENAQFQTDLSTCRLDLDAARYNLARRDREIETFEAEVARANGELEAATKFRQQHEENLKNGTYAQRDEQRLKTYEEVVNKLRAQVKETEDSKKQVMMKFNDMEFEIKKLEAEARVSLTLAESRRGQEAAVASLESQLKNAIEDRDAAYQIILDCGKCKTSEPGDDKSETDSRSRGTSDPKDQSEITPLDTPAADDEPVTAEAKKKKKKKSKSKAKKDPEGNDVAKAPDNEVIVKALEALKQQRDERESNDDEIRGHFESLIEERDQRLKDQLVIIKDREDEIHKLKSEIQTKQQAIEKLEKSLKDQEDLEEEVETLRESLTDVGGEVTNAKRQATDAVESKTKLQEQLQEAEADASKVRKQLHDSKAEAKKMSDRCSQLEKEVAEAAEKYNASDSLQQTLQNTKDDYEKRSKDYESQHKSLSIDFERIKAQATTLETDLHAANMLAQNRYKELTDMKQTFSKVQPELKRLREESTELKDQKSELDKANSAIRKLEGKDRDLRAEINEYKSQITKRDLEITDLKDKARKARERCSALEDTYERSRRDIEEHQRIRDEAVDAREKLQQQLEKAQQDRRTLKAQVDDFDKQIKKVTDESRSLRDEVQVKTAKHASAQSLMDSLENQSRELAVQLKEVQSRCDGLEEELADSQRLLSERSREAETMRRLLADVEGRADSRVKEMRERLDLATEERDRAEDESSSLGRKKAREVEDYKNRLRDLERDVTRSNEVKSDAERKEQDLRVRHEDLERRFAFAQSEVTEVRTAMTQLRDTLDEGERQARDLEKQKTDLRKTLEERELRLEKLQKSSKAMAEELRALQTTNKRQPSVQSSRSSIDARVGSPIGNSAPGKQDQSIDYVYLKNILLQFLEQKEKRTQMQLIPVLGMLLHFDKSEEARWMSVVSAK